MAILFVTIFVLLLNLSISAQDLQCNKGIKITVSGNTYDNWQTEVCATDSKCVRQEVKFNVGIDVTLRFGSCLSSTSPPLLECVENFGPNGSFDHADLLNLLPVITGGFTRDVAESAAELYEEFKTFATTGEGAEDLIDRVFDLATDIGYNLETFEPLKSPLANVLDTIFGQDDTANEKNCSGFIECLFETIQNTLTDLLPDTLLTPLRYIFGTGKRVTNILDSLIELIKAIGNLDTSTDVDYAEEIYKFAENFMNGPTIFTLKHTPIVNTVIEKLPELIRIVLPPRPVNLLLYDVSFELLGDVNLSNWTQTIKDMKTTIKDQIPSYLKPVVDPLFDVISDSTQKQNGETSSDIQKTSTSDAIMQLMKDAFSWIIRGSEQEYTLKSFVAAIKPALHNVTVSITGVVVHPIFCESKECSVNLCNTLNDTESQTTPDYIESQTTSNATESQTLLDNAYNQITPNDNGSQNPTSGGEILSSHVVLNVAIIWITINAL